MELKGKKINFLGDSITEGVGLSADDKHFFDVLKRRAGLAEARNYGISGTRIARQQSPTVDNPRFDLDYCSRVDEMDADADAIVVFGGTNDFGHGDAPIGHPDDRTPDTFYGAMHTLIRKLLARYPQSEIVFMTPLHRADETCGKADPSLYGDLIDYVDIIREICEIYSIPVLDLYASAGICPAVEISRVTYCPDGLHPNDLGHERIAGRLESFLRAL
ncbi:MAG: SGNH/GDSL hydrolase family protein [Clostridia bacterium]|nr:SGNH/GDSL hydrolase family protein [Clostridia bacterium]